MYIILENFLQVLLLCLVVHLIVKNLFLLFDDNGSRMSANDVADKSIHKKMYNYKKEKKLMKTKEKNKIYTIKEGLEKLKDALKTKKKKPILFIGSGLSRRYLDSPDWEGLLRIIAAEIDGDYELIKGRCNGEFEKIAQELECYCFRKADDNKIEKYSRRDIFREKIAVLFKKYCNDLKKNYGESKEQFLIENKEFNQDINTRLRNIESIKHTEDDCAKKYKELADELNKYSEKYKKIIEIQELQKITPKAIITTNYDTLLEDIVFANRLKSYIGQENFINVSDEDNEKIDLYKIHGCVKKPDSIIITKEDYDDFFQKSKYLYSKLFTMFWEYPLIFIGYSISDRNIKDILTVMIDVMTEEQKKDFLKNIWVIDYVDNQQSECVATRNVELLNGKSIEITCFQLKHYDALFKTINQVVLSQNFGDLKFTLSDNVIELLIKPLYQQQDNLKVVTRELLQNALDACKKKDIDAQIKIKIFEENGTKYLEIKDNGIGMGLQEIRENFLTVGKTDKKNSQKGLVGKYGVGVLSIFLIGDYAEVYTKKENGTLLALKLYIGDQKKQVSWLDTSSDYEKDMTQKSFTTIKISLNNDINIEQGKNSEDYLKQLGLENYMVRGKNFIEVNCMGEFSEITKLSTEGLFLDLADNVKLYNEDSLKEDSNNKCDQKLKKILEKKNIVFFNDMISTATYDKQKYKQLNNSDIPFIVLNIKNVGEAETEFKTDLSRSNVHISGEMMKNIARGIYKLEITKMMDVIVKEKQRLLQQEIDVYDLIKQIKDNCAIINENVDILMGTNKLLFSRQSNLKYVQVCGNESNIKRLIKHFNKPLLYNNGDMSKSLIGDMIINNRIIAISIKYLDEYIYKATNPYNGLKKEALIKVLKKVNVGHIDNLSSSIEIWKRIRENREKIKTAYNNAAKNGMIWFDDSYNANLEQTKNNLIIFNSSIVKKYLDNDFYQILQEEVKKNEIDDVIQFLN